MSVQYSEKYTIKERLMILRALAGFSKRKAFAEYTKIPAPTLEAWERETNPISNKGAQRLLNQLAKMGVSCSEEWLLSCVGAPPALAFSSRSDISHNIKNLPTDCLIPHKILNEVEMFVQSNPLSCISMITEDSMIPTFNASDLVGGIQVNNLSQGLQKNVIVELGNGKTLVRRLIRGADEYKYSLVSINPQTNVTDPIIFNANIKKCYIIVWHRIISKYDMK